MAKPSLKKLDRSWSKIPVSYRGGIIRATPSLRMIVIPVL